MHSRRNFLGNVATGLAAAAQPSGRVLGANDKIRVGIIGPGFGRSEPEFTWEKTDKAKILRKDAGL